MTDYQVVDKKVTLTLVGLDGNAFFLMGAFQRQARKEKWTQDEIKLVLDKCMSGNNDLLLCTLSAHCEEEEDDGYNEDGYDDEEDEEEDN